MGVLLLVAALLKLSAGDAGALGQNAVLFSPAVQMLSVVAELLLGGWLVSGQRRVECWAATLVFFALMAGVSLWLAAEGRNSCGCFGRITVHPWATFGLDVAILLGLATTRPASQTRPLATSSIRPVAAIVAGAVLIIGLGSSGLMAYWNVGPEGLVARLRGETISLSPFLTDLGAKPAGERSEFHLTVTNYSDRTIHLVGGSASCSCAVLDELPIEIPAHESRDVAVRAAFKGTPGRFQHEVLLYTDVPGQSQMASRFGGVVTAANQ